MNRVSLIVAMLGALPAFSQTPVISDSGIVNSVTRDSTQPVAPGSIVSIFGNQLASTSATADSVPLSMSIAGVSVTFNGIPAAIRLVSPTLISVQVPWETVAADGTTTGTASVVVTQNGTPSDAKNVALAAYSPGIYAIDNLARTNMALAINADGSLAQPVGLIPGLTSHPAQSGDVLMLLATGLGPVDQPIVDGATSSDMTRNALTLPQVMLAGIGTTVTSATLSSSFVGAYQVQITVPTGIGSSDAAPLTLQAGGASSPTTTTIAVVTPASPQ